MSRLKYYNPQIFKASGDCGDIIYALMYIKALNAKKLFIDGSGGETYVRDGYICNVKTKFNTESAKFMLPFVATQIDCDFWHGEPFDCHINESDINAGDINITKAHAIKFDLDWTILGDQWLFLNEAKEKRLVINRTNRYHGTNFGFYKKYIEEFDGSKVFLGLPDEFNEFSYKSKLDIPYIKTSNCLDLAKEVAKSTHFIGNGSLVNSLAIGFGLDVKYEFCSRAANYLFEKENFNIF